MTSGENRSDGSSPLLQSAVLGRVWSASWRHLPVLAVAAVASGLPLAVAVLLTGGISVLTAADGGRAGLAPLGVEPVTITT